MKSVFKMFKLFYNDNGYDQDDYASQKICINLNQVAGVQPCGQWHEDEFAVPVVPPPRRNNAGRLVPPRARNPRSFIQDKTCFTLNMVNGNNWKVEGSFDEFCDLLTSFSSHKETVK